MKKSRQKKSRTYYYFWSFMALTVFLGQLYVGTGYRLLNNSMQEIFDKVDGVILRNAEPYDEPDYL
tara:strand:- start:914 stop:1111 length:198 start_codon:yes stop_codon:yes gene_type:complete